MKKIGDLLRSKLLEEEEPKKVEPPKNEETKKPKGIKLREYVDKGVKITEINYGKSDIYIKLFHNFYKENELYLEDFSNQNPKKKGEARGILYNIVDWLVFNKNVGIDDKFTLHAKTLKSGNQAKLEEMYKKMGFVKIGGSDDKPKYSMSVKSYLQSNKPGIPKQETPKETPKKTEVKKEDEQFKIKKNGDIILLMPNVKIRTYYQFMTADRKNLFELAEKDIKNKDMTKEEGKTLFKLRPTNNKIIKAVISKKDDVIITQKNIPFLISIAELYADDSTIPIPPSFAYFKKLVISLKALVGK